MDIQREIKKKSIWKKYWYVGPIGLLISLTVWGKVFLGETSFVVDKDRIQLAQVEQGDFKVEVRAIGVLKPQDIRLIPSLVSGRVEQILVKPGTHVEKGQPLIKLSNPDLLRNMEKARWELQASKAEMQAALVSLESQLVDLENSVDEAEFNYKSTKLKLDAESELIKKGNGSISKLDYQRTKLSVAHQKQRWSAQIKRTIKMRENMQASQSARQARLELAESSFQSVQQQVNDLTVKSSMGGIIQQSSIVLGQQVEIGASVVTIANKDSLFAELQVQELQIQDIKVGQDVTIDTRSNEIIGRVIRIDPRVNAGMVQIDVALDGIMPSEARPDLNVEGRIIINLIRDTLFVKRPAFAPRNTKTNLFRLSENGQFASKQSVDLGLTSVTHIQILSGLESGDSIITSDISKFQQHKQVLLN
jgi:multidrug resistance efflux pump